MQVDARRNAHRHSGPGRLAALAVLVSLAAGACTGGSATPPIIYLPFPSASPSATPTVGPASAEPSGSGAPSGSVAPSATVAPKGPTVSSTTVSSAASDGRWTVKFDKPVVAGVTSAAAMNTSITTKVNSYISSFTGSGLPVPAGGDGPSTLVGAFSVAYASPTLLSLRFVVTTYATGAAHPGTEVGSVNFNVTSGAVVQLPDIFSSAGAALSVLRTKAHAALVAKLGSDLSWPASVTMSDFGKAWVFTPGGLELSWSQGDIASAAAGPVTISIPWSQLKSIIANPGPAAGFVA